MGNLSSAERNRKIIFFIEYLLIFNCSLMIYVFFVFDDLCFFEFFIINYKLLVSIVDRVNSLLDKSEDKNFV